MNGTGKVWAYVAPSMVLAGIEGSAAVDGDCVARAAVRHVMASLESRRA